MRDVTIYVYEGGKLGLVPWNDRDNPTEEELRPEGAEKMLYGPMPHDFVDKLVGKTKDEINEIMQSYFHKK